MKEPLHIRMQAMTPEAILSELSVGVYESPLVELRDAIPDLPDAIRVPMLIIDFDTEVTMNSILGFLENSTGLYLRETIEAFTIVGAADTAGVLSHIARIMDTHGVTAQRLRDDLNRLEEFTLSTFREVHGESVVPMTEAVCEAAEGLYLYSEPGEAVFNLLERFVQGHRSELQDALRRCGA